MDYSTKIKPHLDIYLKTNKQNISLHQERILKHFFGKQINEKIS